MYSFKYKGEKTFEYGTIALRLAREDGTAVDAPVHTDFLKPLSGLMRKMDEDAVNSGDLKTIILPSNATIEAVDEFLCTVYNVEWEVDCYHKGIDMFVEDVLNAVSVLDFFQAPDSFYAKKDELIPRRMAGTGSINNQILVKILVKLENFRETLPKSFFATKKTVLCNNIYSGFGHKMFVDHESLAALRPDTLIDLWQGSQIAQGMIWLSEAETNERMFRKRKLEADDMAERAEVIARHFHCTTWKPTFTVFTAGVDVTVQAGDDERWPLRLAEIPVDRGVFGSYCDCDRIVVETTNVSVAPGLKLSNTAYLSAHDLGLDDKMHFAGGKVFVRGTLTIRTVSKEKVIEMPQWVENFGGMYFVNGWTSFTFVGSVRVFKY